MTWTPERIEELLKLYRSGKTYTWMAAHFGTSKNAISGKLDRVLKKLGERVERPVKSETVAKRKYTRTESVLTLPRHAGSVSKFRAPKPAKPNEGQLASILDVTGCKWAVREDASFIGGHAFCNHPTDGKSSYCAFHAKEAVAHYSRTLINKTLRPFGLRFPKAAA